MKSEDFLEIKTLVDAYKPVFDEVMDEYGSDVEDLMIRIARSSARVQTEMYREFRNQGFTDKEAMTLTLNAKFTMLDFRSKS